MTISFTNHAVERYLQFHELDDRTDPRDATQVRAKLEDAATRAVKLPVKTRRGHTQWQLQELGIEIITKHDDGVDVCVTILPPPRLRGLDPRTAELIEGRLREISARQPVIEAERAQVAAQNDKIPVGVKAAQHQQKISLKIKELKAEAMLLANEAEVLKPILKTMRQALTMDRNEIQLKRALKIALAHLRSLPSEKTKDTFHRIWLVDPCLVGNKFIDHDTATGGEENEQEEQ